MNWNWLEIFGAVFLVLGFALAALCLWTLLLDDEDWYP